jgi:hypothetical protein
MSSKKFRYIDLHIFYRYHHLLFQTAFNTELLTQGYIYTPTMLTILLFVIILVLG